MAAARVHRVVWRVKEEGCTSTSFIFRPALAVKSELQCELRYTLSKCDMRDPLTKFIADDTGKLEHVSICFRSEELAW